MIGISLNDIVEIQKLIIIATGGEEGVLSESMLLSALESPFATFDGVHLNRTDYFRNKK